MKISIVTVAFNSDKTIEDTLKSVAKQTYSDIEHIIVDGGSTDNTLTIVGRYPHVDRVLSEPDEGIYDAMNKGVKICSGDIIGIINSDDIFYNDTILELVSNCFQSDETIDALFGNIEYFETGAINKIVRFWKSSNYHNSYFENGDVPPHPSLFVRKQVYQDYGYYEKSYQIAADYDFMFRILKIHKLKSRYLDETIVKMRIGGISTAGFKSYWISMNEIINIWKKNGFKFPIRLLFLRPIKKIRQKFSLN